jgi:hypothetical protein
MVHSTTNSDKARTSVQKFDGVKKPEVVEFDFCTDFFGE